MRGLPPSRKDGTRRWELRVFIGRDPARAKHDCFIYRRTQGLPNWDSPSTLSFLGPIHSRGLLRAPIALIHSILYD